MVPAMGVEPIRCCHHGILSPARLPIPSRRRNLVCPTGLEPVRLLTRPSNVRVCHSATGTTRNYEKHHTTNFYNCKESFAYLTQLHINLLFFSFRVFRIRYFLFLRFFYGIPTVPVLTIFVEVIEHISLFISAKAFRG